MKLIHTQTAIILALLLSSCTAVYVPNTHNIPLLSEQGDININTSAGTNGYDFQGSYAVSDHLGVMTNISAANTTSDSTRNFHKHLFVEGGPGYYLKLSDAARFEVFGTAGYGYVSGLYGYYFISYTEDIVEGNFYRFAIQPTIGATTDYFDGAFAVKLAYFSTVNLKTNQDFSYYGKPYSPPELSAFLIEPTITVRGGYKFVMFNVQTGVSLPVDATPDFRWRPFIFSVGLTYKMNFMGNKKAAIVE